LLRRESWSDDDASSRDRRRPLSCVKRLPE
jgi:hypothetical protein